MYASSELFWAEGLLRDERPTTFYVRHEIACSLLQVTEKFESKENAVEKQVIHVFAGDCKTHESACVIRHPQAIQ